MKHLMTMTFLVALMPSAMAGNFQTLDMADGKVGTRDEALPMEQFCGNEPLRVAYSDGWGGNFWRRATRAEFEDEAAKCPNITEVRYTDAEGNPQKQISDIQGLIAQGFDAIIVQPDGGAAIVRAMRQAMDRGIAVVPFETGNSFPGKAGVDYVVNVSPDVIGIGRSSAEWMVKALGGTGNVIVLGGTPGNSYTANQAIGWKEVFDATPGITVLEGPVVTNWDPAKAQQVMTAMLSKYDQIDGLLSETTGPIRAYQAAGKSVPAWVGQDGNEASCLFVELSPEMSDFKMANLESHTWTVRTALRKAIAAANGLDDPEPSIIEVPMFEDSLSDDPALAIKCDPELAPGAILSSGLSKEKQQDMLGQ